MSEVDKKLAQESAELASRQAGYAASNVADAVSHGKDYAVELIGFTFRTHSTPIAIASVVVATSFSALAIYGGRTLVKELRAKRAPKTIVEETS